MLDPAGQTLANRYHLLAKLGEGSMASVYRAEDWVRGWLMAIKVMKAHKLGGPVALGRRASRLDVVIGLQRELCSNAPQLSVATSGVRQVVAQARRY